MKKRAVLFGLLTAFLCLASLQASTTIITENEVTKTILCKGDEIYVNGNENVLTLKGTVKKLIVTGNFNKIMAEAVDYIDTAGNKNYISWETGVSAAKPAVNNPGIGNIIKRASVGSEPKTQAPPETKKPAKSQTSSNKTVDDAISTLQNLSGAAEGSITNMVSIDKSGVVKTITLVDQNLTITGDSNDITVLGTCLTLYLTGNNNKVWFDSVAKIKITGDNNHVGWEDGYKGEDPSVVTTGKDNKVVREDR